jgi:hypothetical protein
MAPRQPLTSTGYAFKAGDAQTVEGLSAGSLDQSAHVTDPNNPHGVSAAQVGAVSAAELTSHAGQSDAHHSKTTLFSELNGSATDAQIPNDITVNSASNADTVDGLHASGVAVGGRLLALDGSGKFPNSVLHTGSGSGLDADTVDGLHANAFSIASHAHSSLNAVDGDPLQALFVDGVGRVGIGTKTPVEELHIAGVNPRVLLQETGTSNPEINFQSAGSNNWALYKKSSTGDLRFFQGSSDKLMIQNDTGNVGIGTIAPDHKLHVIGLAKFELGGGSIAITTPGARPGMIAFAQNGNRRDVTVYNEGIAITSSNSSAAPSSANGLFVHENGNTGFGTLNPLHKVDVNGRVRTKTLEITGGADLSEPFDVTKRSDRLKPLPGMVVTIDPDHEGALVISDRAYNRRVAGIISGAGDVSPGMLMGQTGTVADGAYPVALTGRVYCLAETSGGTIEPGDLLTTSDVPGYAMKVTDYDRAQGAILGKAMTRLDEGKGQVLVLVSLQ